MASTVCVERLGGDAHPAFRRQDLSLACSQGARRQARALSGGSGRCASLYNGIISSQPRLQNLAMFPVLALQHKLSDFQLLSDTLTGTRSPSSEYTCLKPLLPWELQTWHAVIHCIFIPSRRTCKTMSHLRKGINSQNSLCNVGKCSERLLLEEHGNILKVIRPSHTLCNLFL